MSDATFLDNQEVTAEDLNNIAIDLGYPDYSHFPEETPPSAVSALNQITADLVSAGVLLTGNRCAITYSNGSIYVDTGIIVFESGAKKRIESMQQLQALEGTSCVYALNNTVENTISLVCASEFPTEGDFVKLASVQNGNVTGLRKFSTAKVDLPTENYCDKIADFGLNWEGRTNIGSEAGKGYILKKTIELSSDKFTHIYCESSRYSDFRLPTSYFGDVRNGGFEAADTIYEFKIVKDGNKLNIYTRLGEGYTGYQGLNFRNFTVV